MTQKQPIRGILNFKQEKCKWCEGYGEKHEYLLFNTQEEMAYHLFLG